MRKNPRVGVVLTPEARDLFKDDPLQLCINKGMYLNCESAEQIGSFLRMRVVRMDEKGEAMTSEIDLPIQYVLYLVSAEGQVAMGFK